MKRLKSIILAAFAVVLAVLSATPSLPAAAAGSAALGITPRKDYLVEPGKGVDDKLLIRNLDTSAPLQITLRVVDFTYTGDGGTPKLFLDENAPQTTWSMKSFLTLPETVTVPAGGSKTVDMSVHIPANQGAGSYYSAILYATGAPDGGNVGLSASGVTLVFTTVPGTVKEDLSLKKFGAYKTPAEAKMTGYTYVTADMPFNIGYTLENAGNVAESPVGSISYKWMFGSKVTINEVNPNGSLALIGQTRTFTTCIKSQGQTVDLQGEKSKATACVDPGLWPGYYSLSLDLYYGLNGNLTQEIIGHGGFWYLPIWFIVVFIIFLLALAFFIWRTYNKIRTALYGSKMKKSLRRRK